MSGNSQGSTRRGFLVRTAAALSVAGLPASAYARVPGAHDRIRLGIIGCGPYTISDLFLFVWLRRTSHNLSVKAVCDVFRPHAAIASEKTGGAPTDDYRAILEDPEIDAVIIATPDHWHAQIAIEAARAGKDIYLEAPMTRTWQEAVALYDAVRQNNVIFQCGAQLCSDDRYHQAKQLLDAGAIGSLAYAQATMNRNSRVGYYNRQMWPDLNPQNLDWVRWQGPARKHDFDPERVVRWRKYWDYSGGTCTNLIFQPLAALMISLGPRLPLRVSSSGGTFLDRSVESPDTYFATFDYESYSIQINSCLANEQSSPTSFFGHEGTIRVADTLQVVRERYFVKEFREREEQGLLNVVEKSRPDHMLNWIECLRTRERPVCNEEVAQAAMIAAHLGELSYRQNRVYSFNAQTRQIVQGG